MKNEHICAQLLREKGPVSLKKQEKWMYRDYLSLDSAQ